MNAAESAWKGSRPSQHGQLKPVHTGEALRNGGDLDLGQVGHVPPLVPEADYQVGFIRAERGHFENRQRLFLWFKIITPGPSFGIELYLVCPCPANGGKVFGLGSKLVAAATVALGHRPKRRDRLSTRMFAGKVFLARTRTVTLDYHQRPRPPTDHYSVLSELLGIEAGG